MKEVKFKITDIQLFDYAQEVQIGETEYETVYSYSANIIINDEFVAQVHGDKDEATFDGVCEAVECFWESEKLQDLACENIDNAELEAALEKAGFENNIGWLEDNATDVINPENAILRSC